MIKIGCILVIVYLVSWNTGCSVSDADTFFYVSDDHLSGVVVYQDSLKISSPYFSEVVLFDYGAVSLPVTKKIDHPAFSTSLEISVDSAILYVKNARFANYRTTHRRTSWDSIVVEQRYLNSSLSTRSRIKIYQNSEILILGKWKEKIRRCDKGYMLANSTLANQLDLELGYLSNSSFDLAFTGQSEAITYLYLKKCLDGKCDDYEGDQIGANFFALEHFLSAPSNFIVCDTSN